MKKYLIFIIVATLSFTNVLAQNYRDSILTKFKLLNNITEFDQNTNYGEIIKFISNNESKIFFKIDSELTNEINLFINRTNNIGHDIEWKINLLTIRYKAMRYLKSLKYVNIYPNNVSFLYALLTHEDEYFINDTIKNSNGQDICDALQLLKSELEYKDATMNFKFLDTAFKAKILPCILDLFHSSLNPDPNKYLLVEIYHFNPSIVPLSSANYQLVFDAFMQHYDSTSSIHQNIYMLYHRDPNIIAAEESAARITAQEKYYDSIKLAKKLELAHYKDSVAVGFKKGRLSPSEQYIYDLFWREDYDPRNIPRTDFSTMAPDAERQLWASQDTTLYSFESDYRPVNGGDDAMRFDTLTDDHLFAALAGINFKELADSLRLSHQFDASTPMIHLRKITQLLGDRQIAHTLIIKPPQQEQLERLLDFIELQKNEFYGSDWDAELTVLLFRLWPLAYPRIKSWINSPHFNLNLFAVRHLHYFADEAFIIEMMEKYHTAAKENNIKLMENYIAILSPIDTNMNPETSNYGLPPRRMIHRSYEQSQQWCKKYIYQIIKPWKRN